MPEQEQGVVVSYDARLAPICGGVAPALLFCYFEKCFREAGYPATGIERENLRAWRTPLGYKHPQPWFDNFWQIGVLHHGAAKYRAAVRAQRQFWSYRRERYVFYAMEVPADGAPASLYRNALLIERELNRAYGDSRDPAFEQEHRGAFVAAREDAATFHNRLVQGRYMRPDVTPRVTGQG